MIYEKKIISTEGNPKEKGIYFTETGEIFYNGEYFTYLGNKMKPLWYLIPLPEEAIAVVPIDRHEVKENDILWWGDEWVECDTKDCINLNDEFWTDSDIFLKKL